jgi:hypothetical protein
VSLSATAGPAADGLAKCHVAIHADQIAGIGIVAHGTLVKEYVPVVVGPARPFFEARRTECPQGDSNP